MNYSCYKDAFSALVQENDGVLPDLYESINITISCHPVSAPALLTVADVVAYAIIEASHEFRAVTPDTEPAILPLFSTRPNHGLVCLEHLVTQAAASHN